MMFFFISQSSSGTQSFDVMFVKTKRTFDLKDEYEEKSGENFTILHN